MKIQIAVLMFIILCVSGWANARMNQPALDAQLRAQPSAQLKCREAGVILIKGDAAYFHGKVYNWLAYPASINVDEGFTLALYANKSLQGLFACSL